MMNFKMSRVDFFLFCCIPLVLIDSLSGFIFHKYGINSSLSLIYKAFLIALMLYFSFIDNYKAFVFKISFLIYGFFLVATRNIDVLSLSLIAYEYAIFLKAFLWILATIYLYGFKPTHLTFRLAGFVAISYFIGVCVNIIMGPLLGGMTTYADGTGSKGFFIAGNEVAATLIIAFCLSSFWLIKLKYKYLYSIVTIMAFAASILLGTKSALGGVFLVFLSTILFLIRTSFFVKIMVSILLGILVLIANRWGNTSFEFSSVFVFLERLVFFIEQYGLLSALLSNRDEHLSVIFIDYYLNLGIPELIFGVGRSYLLNLPNDIIEMDLFDVTVWFGLIGLMFWIFFSFFYLISFLHCSKRARNFLFVNFLILMSVAFFAGHVFMSGMTSFLIPIYYITANCERNGE